MGKERTKITQMNNRYTKDSEAIKKTRARRRVALVRRLFGFAVLLVVVCGLLGFTYTKQAMLLNKKQTEKVQQDKELASLQEEKKTLTHQINQLHDNDYLTKLARSEYYLSKEGEIIFNTPNTKDKKKESAN